MTTATNVFALTRDQIKALKTADDICFDYHAGQQESTGLRATKRGKAPWYEETTIRVQCPSSVHVYDDRTEEQGRYPYDVCQGKEARCFEMIHYSRYSGEWQTIAGLLKVGDEIRLRWEANGGNQYVERSTVTAKSEGGSPGLGERLYHDRLYLEVWRGGKKKYTFYVRDSICPNNTARMIKPRDGWTG